MCNYEAFLIQYFSYLKLLEKENSIKRSEIDRLEINRYYESLNDVTIFILRMTFL